MDFLAGSLDVDAAKNFLGQAAQSQLTQGLIVIGFLWHAMGRKVSEHFGELERIASKLEESVTAVAHELSDLRQMVEKGLSTRLEAAENRLTALEGVSAAAGTAQTNKGETHG